ncbi:hypothetical protein ColLi_13273 [Colletotrichum liriopes]|uniref:Ubiquitin-like protease family profile domain-containing protein n=1 Tax=Colletotrichum liriopes TaxID=708192 RepID=A0AA37H182_9PEZI|nr:hypothetical protein ColLi_13273 [Colletotrichum liriopes]
MEPATPAPSALDAALDALKEAVVAQASAKQGTAVLAAWDTVRHLFESAVAANKDAAADAMNGHNGDDGDDAPCPSSFESWALHNIDAQILIPVCDMTFGQLLEINASLSAFAQRVRHRLRSLAKFHGQDPRVVCFALGTCVALDKPCLEALHSLAVKRPDVSLAVVVNRFHANLMLRPSPPNPASRRKALRAALETFDRHIWPRNTTKRKRAQDADAAYIVSPQSSPPPLSPVSPSELPSPVVDPLAGDDPMPEPPSILHAEAGLDFEHYDGLDLDPDSDIGSEQQRLSPEGDDALAPPDDSSLSEPEVPRRARVPPHPASNVASPYRTADPAFSLDAAETIPLMHAEHSMTLKKPWQRPGTSPSSGAGMGEPLSKRQRRQSSAFFIRRDASSPPEIDDVLYYGKPEDSTVLEDDTHSESESAACDASAPPSPRSPVRGLSSSEELPQPEADGDGHQSPSIARVTTIANPNQSLPATPGPSSLLAKAVSACDAPSVSTAHARKKMESNIEELLSCRWRLAAGCWLNDAIVNTLLHRLRSPSVGVESWKRVPGWLLSEASRPLLLIPINWNSEHWLLFAYSAADDALWAYDSLRNAQVCKGVARQIVVPFLVWLCGKEVVASVVILEPNNHDCGVYVVCAAQRLAHLPPPGIANAVGATIPLLPPVFHGSRERRYMDRVLLASPSASPCQEAWELVTDAEPMDSATTLLGIWAWQEQIRQPAGKLGRSLRHLPQLHQRRKEQFVVIETRLLALHARMAMIFGLHARHIQHLERAMSMKQKEAVARARLERATETANDVNVLRAAMAASDRIRQRGKDMAALEDMEPSDVQTIHNAVEVFGEQGRVILHLASVDDGQMQRLRREHEALRQQVHDAYLSAVTSLLILRYAASRADREAKQITEERSSLFFSPGALAVGNH